MNTKKTSNSLCTNRIWLCVIILFAFVNVFGSDEFISLRNISDLEKKRFSVEDWLAKQPVKLGEKTKWSGFDGDGDFKKGNIPFYSGSTLMHFAAADDRLDVMKWLKEQGEDVNAENNYTETPMYIASIYGNLEIMKWLKDQGADINFKVRGGRTLMHYAADGGHLEVMKWLKDQGAEINVKANGFGWDSIYGYTPMHSASVGGHLEVMKWLKEQGADVNDKTSYGNTPMSLASGHLEVMKWLKEQGADINTKNNFGITLMHSAAVGGHIEIMAWLKEQGADVNAKTNASGETPLDTANWILAQRVTESTKERARNSIKWLKENGGVTGKKE